MSKNTRKMNHKKNVEAGRKSWITRRENEERRFYSTLTPAQKAAFTRRKNNGVDFYDNKRITLGN